MKLKDKRHKSKIGNGVNGLGGLASGLCLPHPLFLARARAQSVSFTTTELTEGILSEGHLNIYFGLYL